MQGFLADLVQLTIYGLILGSIISLGAIGLSLVYGILRFPHFAHGDLMTLGAYFALVAVVFVGSPVLIAMIFAILATAAVAIGVDQVVYRRLRRTKPVILLISSVGTALILRSAIQLVWGSRNQVYEEGIQIPYRVGGFAIKPDHLVIVGGTLAIVIALHFFLQRTRVGKAMRAMSDNPDLAQITGISTERIIMWTWFLGAALAAAAGVFYAMDTHLHPVMGWRLLLPVFAAAILGGIGKPYGAIVGGLVIGVAQEVSTMFISPAYKPAVAFGIMILMLIVRPTGLFAGKKI